MLFGVNYTGIKRRSYTGKQYQKRAGCDAVRYDKGEEPFYEAELPDEEEKPFHEPDISDEEEQETSDRPELKLTKQESRWAALGALKAALLIGSVYLIGGALLIWAMLALWK